MKKIAFHAIVIALFMLLSLLLIRLGSPYDLIWVSFGSVLFLAAVYGVGHHWFERRPGRIRSDSGWD